MPAFSDRSRANLSTCHPDLQRLFLRVVDTFDCTILEGHRGKEGQDAAVAAGTTRVAWPNSRHNRHPSMAVDAAPWPIDWNDTDRFLVFGGFVLGTAREQGLVIRWGGDWDSDWNLRDQTFIDLPHFELVYHPSTHPIPRTTT